MTTILAIDFDPWAAKTYAANFPETEVRCADVADELHNLPYADVILAGFPCQPHSVAGKRLASEDTRDGGNAFVAAIERVMPRMFLGENVPGLLTSEDGRYVVRLVELMEAAGYQVQYRVLDAVDYGVPQFRARVFFWGIRNDVFESGVRWQWPKRTHVDPETRGGMFGDDLPAWITVGQALGIWYPGCDDGIRRLRGASVERRDHGVNEPCPTVMAPTGGKSGLCRVIGGGRHDIAPKTTRTLRSNRVACADQLIEIDPKHPVNTPDSPAQTMRSGGDGHGPTNNSVRVAYDHGVAECTEPSPTLNAGGNVDRNGKQGGGCPAVLSLDTKQVRTESSIANPSGTVAHDDRRALKSNGKLVRRLTPQECARLQSVPDSFAWPNGITKTAMYRITGNGMACAVMSALATAFKRADPKSKTVLDLFAGGGLGATGWHGRYWKYTQETAHV